MVFYDKKVHSQQTLTAPTVELARCPAGYELPGPACHARIYIFNYNL